jgi:hypothetical protein
MRMSQLFARTLRDAPADADRVVLSVDPALSTNSRALVRRVNAALLEKQAAKDCGQHKKSDGGVIDAS